MDEAVIQGIAPAVIGVMTVALARMAPHAAPDPLGLLVLAATMIVLLTWRLAPVKLLLGGGVVGIVRNRLCDVPGVRGALCAAVWGR